MEKLWKINRKSIKSIQRGIYFLLIIGIALFVVSIKKGEEDFLTMATWSFSMVSLGLTVTIFITQTIDGWDNSFRTIGGSIPSKKVDRCIFDMYTVIMKGKSLTPKIKKPLSFSTKPKAAQRLVNDIGKHCFKFKEDVFSQTYTCTFMYNWQTFEATSLSREMAICIVIKQAYESDLSSKNQKIKLF